MKLRLKIIFIAILLILIVWGLVGGAQVKNIGITCDFGINEGKTFCWRWHKNIIGDLQDVFKNAGNVVKDTLK